MSFGADGMRNAPLPMLTGTAAVSTRLSEAAVLLSVLRTLTMSTLFYFILFLMMSRPWFFSMQPHRLLHFKSSSQKNVNAFVLIGFNLSVSVNSAMLS